MGSGYPATPVHIWRLCPHPDRVLVVAEYPGCWARLVGEEQVPVGPDWATTVVWPSIAKTETRTRIRTYPSIDLGIKTALLKNIVNALSCVESIAVYVTDWSVSAVSQGVVTELLTNNYKLRQHAQLESAMIPQMVRKRVLFLCTGNSVRSQMAEGILRHLGGDSFDVFSAGTDPQGVHPKSVEVMKEIGIDISRQQSKNTSAFQGQQFDYVITVCDRAHRGCPPFAGAELIPWGFDDPAEASQAERDKIFRRVRDELFRRIRLFLLANKPQFETRTHTASR